MKLVLIFFCVLAVTVGPSLGDDSDSSDLDGSESTKSYGYGYGTKVADQVSLSILIFF